MLATFGLGEVLWSMFVFFIFFLWIMLLFQVFADLFRDHELSGFAKVLWIVFLIIAPFLGVFVYLIARGKSMGERQAAMVKQQDAAMRDYIQTTAGTAASPAEEIARLADLHAKGVIDDNEFAAAKAKLLA